ncbi:MAG: hypothetical protein Q8861_01940 [Bacteroidota bacterium]|nr:hypothetical protein [Bacteroidota bacterium]
MGLFGFFGDVASAAVKVVATPLAVGSDLVNIATGGEVKATEKLIKSVGDSLENAADELMP